MKKCNQITTGELTSYFLNQLEENKKDQIQFHLLQCEECRSKLQTMRAMQEDIFKPEKKSKNIYFFNRYFKFAASIAVIITLSISGYLLLEPTDPANPIHIKNPGIITTKDTLYIIPDTIIPLEEDSLVIMEKHTRE